MSNPTEDVLIEATFSVEMKESVRSWRACYPGLVFSVYAACVVLLAVGIVLRSPIPIIFGVVFLVMFRFLVRRQLRDCHDANPGTVSITEDEYRVEIGDKRVTRTWPSFRSVQRNGDFWVLRISRGVAMALPTRILDADQTTAFEELLRRKNLLRE